MYFNKMILLKLLLLTRKYGFIGRGIISVIFNFPFGGAYNFEACPSVMGLTVYYKFQAQVHIYFIFPTVKAVLISSKTFPYAKNAPFLIKFSITITSKLKNFLSSI